MLPSLLRYLLLLLLTLSPALQAQETRILLLLAYEPLYPVSQQIIEKTQHALQKTFQETIDLNVVYMDADLGASPTYLERFADLLAAKEAQNGKYHALLAAGDAALNFAIAHPEIFKQIPIVFLNVKNQNLVRSLQHKSHFTGILNTPPVYELLDLLHTLYPQNDKIYLIYDQLAHRHSTFQQILAASQARKLTSVVLDLSQLSWAELGAKLADINHQPIVLVSAFSDRLGEIKHSVEGSHFLSEHSASPVWNLWHSGIGSGLAGGIVSDLDDSIQQSITMLQRQFIDQKATIPIIWQPKFIPFIDEMQISRFGFSRQDFPKNSVFINPKSSFFKNNALIIVLLMAFLISISFFIFFIFIKTKQNTKKLQDQTDFVKNLLDTIPDSIFYKDLGSRYVFCNKRARKIINSDPLGHTDHELFEKNIADQFLSSDQKIIKNKESVIEEHWIKTADGKSLLIESRKTPVFQKNGKVIGIFGIGRDITELKKAQENLEYIAHHDALTMLPNRVLLSKKLEYALSLAQRNHEHMAVLYLDLDRFKDVNDSISHDVGDLLLQEVANRIKNNIRESDICSRLGGDEFILVLNQIKDESHIAEKCQQILTAISEPYQLQGHVVTISASIGVSLFPKDGQSAADLIRYADAALHQAKELGRNQSYYYHQGLSNSLSSRLSLEQDLQAALKEQQFYLLYLPILHCNDSQLKKVEVLVRWNHPNYGVILPLEFIPLAEISGLINDLGFWIIQQACQDFLAWKEEGLGIEKISINLSPVQLTSNFCQKLESSLKEIKFNPAWLEFEVKENIFLSHFSEVTKQIAQFKKMGIHTSIDNFGSGYSSIEKLKQIPISALKLDASFIQTIAHSTSDYEVVLAIIQLATSLNISTIAEGIETERQVTLMKEAGCQWLQGYFISQPLLANELGKRIKGEE